MSADDLDALEARCAAERAAADALNALPELPEPPRPVTAEWHAQCEEHMRVSAAHDWALDALHDYALPRLPALVAEVRRLRAALMRARRFVVEHRCHPECTCPTATDREYALAMIALPEWS